MSPAKPLDKAGKLIYRTLLRTAKLFDDNPSMKALITRLSVHPLPQPIDTLVAAFLGGQDRHFYWPSPLIDRSVIEAVKMGFRFPPHDINLDGSLQAVRYLTGLASVAQKHNMTIKKQHLTDILNENESRKIRCDPSLKIIHTPERGALLIAHPCLPEWFAQTVVLLCEHSKKGTHGLCINKQFSNRGTDGGRYDTAAAHESGTEKNQKGGKDSNTILSPGSKSATLTMPTTASRTALEQEKQFAKRERLKQIFMKVLQDLREEEMISQDEDDFAHALQGLVDNGHVDEIFHVFAEPQWNISDDIRQIDDDNDDDSDAPLLPIDIDINFEDGPGQDDDRVGNNRDGAKYLFHMAPEEFNQAVFQLIGKALMTYKDKSGTKSSNQSLAAVEKLVEKSTAPVAGGSSDSPTAASNTTYTDNTSNGNDTSQDTGDSDDDDDEFITAKELMMMVPTTKMYYGGPIPGIDVLHGYPRLGGTQVLPMESTAPGTSSNSERVFVGISSKKKEAHHALMLDEKKDSSEEESNKKLKLFLGHSGWAPHQLQTELEMGSWIMVSLSDTVKFSLFDPVLHTDGGNSSKETVLQEKIWRDMLCMLGPEYKILADVPSGVWKDLMNLYI